MAELKYKALVLDVDGTLTDGGIYLDDNGVQAKRFDVTDGSGIKYFQRVGGVVGLLTGRSSNVVAVRAAELGIKFIVQGALEKAPSFAQLCETMKLPPEQVAYMGDDLPDIPCLNAAGFAIAPANAAAEVKAVADLVTTRAGGHGAVREAIECLLGEELWRCVLERYGPRY